MNILVTAGPTREPIDPVRFISNRSSGKMGYALARAAAERGHRVRLISGPVSLSAPVGVERIGVETAADMLRAVIGQVEWCAALLMVAAVADWRPAVVGAVKTKKSEMPAALPLARTADILETIRPQKGSRTFVGFAAETGDPLSEAQRKLAAKGLDLIVANDVTQPGAGFETDTNRVTLVPAEGDALPLPLMSKAAVAERIIQWVEERRSTLRPSESTHRCG